MEHHPVSPHSATSAHPFGSERASACLLSAVAGYVDTAGFLTLFGLFPSHVTGDLVSVGAIMASGTRVGATERIAMIPLFMSAVAIATFVARRATKRGRASLAPLLILMALGLVLFCLLGVVFSSRASGAGAWPVIVLGGSAVVAMGIQNALMRESLGGVVPTTVMTGNLTQFTINLVDLCLSTLAEDPVKRSQACREAKVRLVNFGVPLLGFLVGVALGGWLTGICGLLSIALPTAITVALASSAWLRARRLEHALALAPMFQRRVPTSGLTPRIT